MRRISANYVYPVASKPIRNGIVEADDDGTIRKIYDFGGEMVELAHTEFLNGVLVPGFINMHTHLELSNLGRIAPANNDLPYFIENIIKLRSEKNALEKAYEADKYFYRKGVVGVGDIANTNLTIPVKKQSKIRYHTFAEVTGLKPDMAQNKMEQLARLYQDYIQNGLQVTMAPHAPYSISGRLWELLSEELKNSGITSMHNQESESENQMFKEGTGQLLKLFKKIDLVSDWAPSNMTSLQTVLKYLSSQKVLLVHNTFTTKNDVEALSSANNSIGFVLCPTSNLQITGKLPNVEMLEHSGMPIMLGTDSLASGQSLDLLDEMKCLQNELNTPFETMLKWVTMDAAAFMQWEDLGSFVPGKKPGINLISGFDFESKSLKSNSVVKRIL